jgi:hypothetical protein
MSAKVLLHRVDTSHRLCPKCVRSTVEDSTTSKSQSSHTLHELDRDEAFTVSYGETVVTPCGLLQNQFRHYLSLPYVETNTMVCRITQNVVESVVQVFASRSKVTNVVTVANLLYTARTKHPPEVEYIRKLVATNDDPQQTNRSSDTNGCVRSSHGAKHRPSTVWWRGLNVFS